MIITIIIKIMITEQVYLTTCSVDLYLSAVSMQRAPVLASAVQHAVPHCTVLSDHQHILAWDTGCDLLTSDPCFDVCQHRLAHWLAVAFADWCLVRSGLHQNCLLVAQRPSNMRVYLRDRSAQTILRAATLRQKLQTKLSIPPSHSILTPGQPVPITPGAWQGSHWSANF